MEMIGQQRRGPFGEMVVLHFEHSSLLEPGQTNGSSLNHQIMWFVTCPIGVLGLLLNALVLVVWGERSSRQSIVFLFKALALMDMVFILMFCIWWYIPGSSIFSILLSVVVFGSQYMLVNVTMLIGVWRWLAFARPIHIHKLLNHFRAKLALAIIVGYCSVFVITERVLVSVLRNELSRIVSIVTPNLLMTLPSFVLVVSMIVLVSFLRRPEVFPNLSSTGHLHYSSNSFGTPAKIRRLTFTILMITISTFIAYPVGAIVLAYYTFSDNNLSALSISTAVCQLLFILNSSIRFFSYFLFMRKFRKMFLLKFITLYTGTYNIKVPSTSEIQSSRVLPDRSYGRRVSYHHSTVVFNDDGTLTVTKAKHSREESRDVKVAFAGVAPPKPVS